MRGRLAVAVLGLAALGVAAWNVADWPAWARLLLTLGVVVVSAVLVIPAVLEHRGEDVQVEEQPKPIVEDRTRRGGDDDGIDVTS